ncbi:MAG: G5 domain-containing protein [Chloroflexota bacterium]
MLVVALALASAGCELSQAGRGQINVRIEADGHVRSASIPAGSTVAEAFRLVGVSAGSLDKTEPPSYVVLEEGDEVRLVRVEERFRTELKTIAFDRQLLRNESLPEGEERLVQAGVNGQEELTFRAIFEDGVQTSEAVIKSVLISEPAAEIVMIGSRSSFSPLAIPGRLVYLSAGNAWIMDTSTANRRLLVNTGDLDGRVFELSPDAKYILFTRRSDKPPDEEINSLWVAPTDAAGGNATSLKASNVVHFAAWYPDSSTRVAYSTVEPRANAPGWQASNDLHRVSLDGTPEKVLDSQSGGIYGWWGTSFAFSPSGRLAYTRPDGIGLVSQDGGYLAPVIGVTPLQTHGDWAWAPGIAWGTDSQTLFFVDHVAALGAETPEESPLFELKAVSLANNATVALAENVGMFAMPSVSPRSDGGGAGAYQIAFLQAIFPEQSDVSRYRLVVMDRDGSNRRELFPSADLPGLEPQRPVWAPGAIASQAGAYLCVVYQGNLWLVDSGGGQPRQITGDGLISGVDWQ